MRRPKVTREFAKEVTEEKEVVFSTKNYFAKISWTNGKMNRIYLKDNDGNLWTTFETAEEIGELRDLLSSLAEEANQVPEA